MVTADDHNPTILNPCFLEREGIVRSEWGWNLADTNFTTPPVAMVSYDSRVNITLEIKKLQVTDSNCTSPSESKAGEIVNSYLRVLRHIPYKAIGINFQYIIDYTNPDAFMKRHFLRKGKWDTNCHPLRRLGLRFVYPLDNGRIRMSLDSARISGDDPKDVISVSTNFHRDCVSQTSADKQIIEYLKNFESDWKRSNLIICDVLEGDVASNLA